MISNLVENAQEDSTRSSYHLKVLEYSRCFGPEALQLAIISYKCG